MAMEFDAPAPTPATIDASFARFHVEHPDVYDRLCAMTRELVAAGHSRVGIGMLFEVLRWEHARSGPADAVSPFKLNNNYRSRYARLIMDREQDLAGVYETRVCPTKGGTQNGNQ